MHARTKSPARPSSDRPPSSFSSLINKSCNLVVDVISSIYYYHNTYPTQFGVRDFATVPHDPRDTSLLCYYLSCCVRSHMNDVKSCVLQVFHCDIMLPAVPRTWITTWLNNLHYYTILWSITILWTRVIDLQHISMGYVYLHDNSYWIIKWTYTGVHVSQR